MKKAISLLSSVAQAVMRPPAQAPVVAAIDLTKTEVSIEERNAAIAAIGQAIAVTVTP